MSKTSKDFWDNAEVIYAYTRAQALEDGVLLDVSEMAKEAGIKFPVALTSAVYGKCVEFPDGITGQDELGRLWDILWMLRCAAGRCQGGYAPLSTLRPKQRPRAARPPRACDVESGFRSGRQG